MIMNVLDCLANVSAFSYLQYASYVLNAAYGHILEHYEQPFSLELASERRPYFGGAVIVHYSKWTVTNRSAKHWKKRKSLRTMLFTHNSMLNYWCLTHWCILSGKTILTLPERERTQFVPQKSRPVFYSMQARFNRTHEIQTHRDSSSGRRSHFPAHFCTFNEKDVWVGKVRPRESADCSKKHGLPLDHSYRSIIWIERKDTTDCEHE